MDSIGAYEAKAHLSSLLRRVIKGERILITKHGIPVAVLQPVEKSYHNDPVATIDQIRDFRKGHRLGDLSVKDLIEEGRR